MNESIIIKLFLVDDIDTDSEEGLEDEEVEEAELLEIFGPLDPEDPIHKYRKIGENIPKRKFKQSQPSMTDSDFDEIDLEDEKK